MDTKAWPLRLSSARLDRDAMTVAPVTSVMPDSWSRGFMGRPERTVDAHRPPSRSG
ncbi:MAG: hypothetical protein JWQ11_4507 [Rhizobacter sp.]|nr:hypothetical protein [Rhizobacter sp.]